MDRVKALEQLASPEVQANFRAQPRFVRAGLLYADKYSQVHAQPPALRLFACELLKNQGNLKFKNADIISALRFYEEALTIFRYVNIILPNPASAEQSSNLEITYVDDNGRSDREKKMIKGLKVILYQNICIVYMKLSGLSRGNNAAFAGVSTGETGGSFFSEETSEKYMEDAYAASCEAVKLDLKAAKALYLRAKSRLRRAHATKDDYKASIKDLRKSLELDEDNVDILDELQRSLEIYEIVKSQEQLKQQQQQQQQQQSQQQSGQFAKSTHTCSPLTKHSQKVSQQLHQHLQQYSQEQSQQQPHQSRQKQQQNSSIIAEGQQIDALELTPESLKESSQESSSKKQQQQQQQKQNNQPAYTNCGSGESSGSGKRQTQDTKGVGGKYSKGDQQMKIAELTNLLRIEQFLHEHQKIIQLKADQESNQQIEEKIKEFIEQKNGYEEELIRFERMKANAGQIAREGSHINWTDPKNNMRFMEQYMATSGDFSETGAATHHDDDEKFLDELLDRISAGQFAEYNQLQKVCRIDSNDLFISNHSFTPLVY